MRCPSCGTNQSKKNKICKQCGFPLEEHPIHMDEPMTSAMELECPNCCAQMELRPDGQSMECPYCGTIVQFTESDEVKKERIRNETIRINYAASLEHQKKQREEESKEVVHAKGTIFWAVLFGLVIVGGIDDRDWISVGVACIQTILMLVILYCKKKRVFLKDDIRFRILKILPFLLIPVFVLADGFDQQIANKRMQNEILKEAQVSYLWPGTTPGKILPAPDLEYGKIIESKETLLKAEIYIVSKNEFTEYIKTCREAGFVYYEKSKDTTFAADNEDHYHLELSWIEDPESYNIMEISLEAPYVMKEFEWPITKCTELLPVPPSNIGHIIVANDEQFYCFISGMDLQAYEDYVDAIIEKGFTVDRRYDKISRLVFPDQPTKTVGIMVQNWDTISILVDFTKDKVSEESSEDVESE